MAKASPVKSNSDALLNGVSVAMFASERAREATIVSCRDALRGGVPQEAIQRRIYLTELARVLADKGAAFSPDMLGEAQRIAELPSPTAKVGDDLKCTDAQWQARATARKALQRMIGALGWMSTGNKTGKPAQTNADQHKARQEAKSEARATPTELATIRDSDPRVVCLWFAGLVAKAEVTAKTNAKLVPADVAAAGAAYFAAVKKWKESIEG